MFDGTAHLQLISINHGPPIFFFLELGWSGNSDISSHILKGGEGYMGKKCYFEQDDEKNS
jgi:hypothetical protein